MNTTPLRAASAQLIGATAFLSCYRITSFYSLYFVGGSTSLIVLLMKQNKTPLGFLDRLVSWCCISGSKKLTLGSRTRDIVTDQLLRWGEWQNNYHIPFRMAHSGNFPFRHWEWGPVWYQSSNVPQYQTHTVPSKQHHAHGSYKR